MDSKQDDEGRFYVDTVLRYIREFILFKVNQSESTTQGLF